ncbi:MAG TPA: tetratricopeptide repeat protein [Gemmataceae bacterium]|jgi:tetratricopeptide (TPR) repeat protein|nr:tetratricopeptide repeat protein [Gemmataceae bacterium]
MKAEHRKELQTNALAQQIARMVEGLKSRPDNKFLIVGSLVVLAVALLVGWNIIRKRNVAKNSEAWRSLNDATSVEDLRKLIEAAEGRMPGRIAQFQEARVWLDQGLKDLGSLREGEAARKKVEEAGKLYAELAEKSDVQRIPLLHQEALLNAGKARESLGDLDGALEFYAKLAQAYPQSALGKQADERAKKIREQRAQVHDLYSKLENLAGRKGSEGP